MIDNDSYLDSHEDLIPFATNLKAAWKTYYQKRTGKPYKPSKRYDSIVEWVKMAEAVVPTGATADDWVHAQFKMSKSLPFVNAARGTVAMANYRRFTQLKVKGSWTEPKQEDEKCTRPVGELEVMGRILDLQYYLKANGKSDTITDSETRNYVLTRLPGLLDPLAVVLLSPTDDIWQVYGPYVEREIKENPLLMDAIKALDMLAAWMYIHEHVCK